jgi:hypothetical protein
MENKYTLKEHGDSFEKEYSEFIMNHLPTYEKINLKDLETLGS